MVTFGKMTRVKSWPELSVLILILLVTFTSSPSASATSEDSECGKSEVRCLCGIPRCVDLKLVNNGVQDCQDFSDEKGQWDPSKCRDRQKRAAISELLRVTNGGATTTFFEGERGRTRPVGILTTTMGSFQVSGTTTEYITKLLATYIKGTYARILTTTSRIYHALPSVAYNPNSNENEIKPTGFITSTMSTEVNGYATTVHTTDFYRTYIDNTYAQQMSAYSNVYYPPWYTDPIQPSATPTESSEESRIYPTPVYIPIDDLMTLDSTPPVIQHYNNGRFGQIIINPGVNELNPVPGGNDFPRRVEGQFLETPSQEEEPLQIFVGPPDVAPPNVAPSFRLGDNEVRVTGTHGNFVAKGDRTYNVFTGTYVQNSQTFLFFFGNTALNPTSPVEEQQQTILVENGAQRDHLLVDMREKLKLIVPGTKERTTIDTMIDGQALEGVMVEIEGSKDSGDDLIMVEGARPTEVPTPHDPRIATVTITLDKNIRKVVSKGKVNVRPVMNEENEIPTGRSVPAYTAPAYSIPVHFVPAYSAPSYVPVPKVMGNPKAEPQIQPSKVNIAFSLPTYTVGQAGNESPRNYYEATTNSDEDLTVYVESSTSPSAKDQIKAPRQPVFQKPGGDRSFTAGRTLQNSPGFSRKPKSFSDLRDLGTNSGWESNDLMSAASSRHATVTYVGFADFTTTVGNTVIVFMPRTRMLEDLNVHVSATKSVPTYVDPTRYTYLTTTEEELPVTTPKLQEPVTMPEIIEITTPKRPEPVTVPEIIEITTPKRPEPVAVPEIIEITTPKRQEPVTVPEIIEITTPKPPAILPRPKFIRNKFGSSSSVIPSETTVLFTGRQTLFNQFRSAGISTRTVAEAPPKVTQSSSQIPVSTQSVAATLEPTHKLETAVFQKDKLNPTGLVSSIGGSFVRDSTTTLVTSLVIGTYIEGSYAQVIKSTSTVFFLPPSATVEPSPIFIKPTPVPVVSSTFPSASASAPKLPISKTFPKIASKPKDPVYSYTFEVTTSNPEDEETTTTFERAEVRVTSSTTEIVTIAKEETVTEAATTTTGRGSSAEEETTTAALPINIQKGDLDEALNEIERARKVAGRPQDQIIVEDKKVDTTLEKPTTDKQPPVEELTTTTEPPQTPPPPPKKEVADVVTEKPEVDQTIYVTKTVPTTVFRTYTYFTTYFIPKEESTVSSIISREVTSTAVGFVKKTFSSILPTATTAQAQPTPVPTTSEPGSFSYEEEEDEDSTPTYYKTYFTTFTYLTTFFTGETSSISSREEVISSVSTITQLPSPASSESAQVTPTISPDVQISSDKILEKDSSVSLAKLPSVVEKTVLKTFYTTYTYFSTLFNGAEASTRSRIEIITNVVPTVMRSTVSAVSEAAIQPTATRDSVQTPFTASHPIEDLSEGGSDVSETSEASQPDSGPDYYELESSEMTTDRSVYNEQELTEVDGGDIQATPALKTLFTTFSFFTTYYKGGSSSVATRLQTITNVVSDGVETEEATDAEHFPVFPITYLTTFTYWTTHFKGESTVVTSREETISNVVTPGVDDISPTATSTDSVEIKPTEDMQREPKKMGLVEESPKIDESELELTTYFTTYTYFTSSYIGDETIVNSRLETVTNVISGTPSAAIVSPTVSTEQQPRAVGNASPHQELIESEQEHLPIGLLSTVTNREIIDQTTTEYLTDVYGTYIDGIYAQVLESTSRIIQPTNIAQTKYILEATETPTGTLVLNQGKTIEGDATTFYQTATVGSVLDGKYAQVISSSSSVQGQGSGDSENLEKTGLVRVIDGSLVQGEKTTFYTSSIYGTIIDNQYGQIIESTTRYVISPTESLTLPVIEPTLSSSEAPLTLTSAEEITATTEGSVELNPLKRLPGRGRDRSRVNAITPTSKSFTPFITPFASRSRPTFTPKRKEATAAVLVSREEVTPTVTATLAPASTRLPLQNKQRFRRPGSDDSSTTTAPVIVTPKLPTATGRSRFQRPGLTPALPTTTAPVSAPTSAQARFTASKRPSIAPAPVATTSPPVRSSISKFSLRPRGSLAPSRPNILAASTTVPTTLPPPVTDPEEKDEEENVTTEQPKSSTAATRFGGNNRFRLNPKLNVQHLLSSTTTEKTTTAPRARKTFTRPTLPTRATPSSSRGTTESFEDEEAPSLDEQESSSLEPSSTTVASVPAKKDLKSLLASRKLSPANTRAPPPPSNSRPQNRQLTTTPSPTPRTTTRRSFAPRARPQGFPSRGLVRGASTTEKSEEELDFDESKHIGNFSDSEIPKDSALLSDVMGVEEGPDLVDSGSEFFETVRSPYESYELYDDLPRGRGGAFLHRRRTRQTRQVDFGSRSRRAEILRTNFRRGGRETSKSNYPFLSSSSDTDASSRDKKADTSSYDNKKDDYAETDYEYYDDPPPPPPTTPKPKMTTSSRAASRFRGRIQSSISPSPAFSSSRQTPFTLLPQTTPRYSRPQSNPAALLSSRRTQSRYRPTSHEYTSTTPPTRTTSRFRSHRNQVTTTFKPKSRFMSPIRNHHNNRAYEEPVYEKPVTEKSRPILTVTHFVPSETTIPVINGKMTEFKTLLIPSPSIEVLSPYQYTFSVGDNGQEVTILNSQVTSTPSIGFGGEVTKYLVKEVPTTTITFTPTTIRGRKTSFSHVLSTHYYTIDPTVSTISLNTFTNSPGDSNQLTNLLLSQLLGSLNLAGLQQQQQPIMKGEPGVPQTQFITRTTTYVTTITDFTSTIVPITLHGKPIKSTIVESQINVLTATELITESTVFTPTAISSGSQTQNSQAPGLNPALLQGLLQQQLNLQIQSTPVQELAMSTVQHSIVTVSTATSEGRRKRDIEEGQINLEEEPAHAGFQMLEPTGENSRDRRGIQLDDSYSYSEGAWITQTQFQDVQEERNVPGRLVMEPGRRLATKIMANGVEVIIRGNQSPMIRINDRMTDAAGGVIVTTLPPTTVSNQFHLQDHPTRPNTAIDHLLQSLARSATPELITKTMMTTFTYFQTVLQNQTTLVRSREQVVANVVTYPTGQAATELPLELVDSMEPTTIEMTTQTHLSTFTFSKTVYDLNGPHIQMQEETHTDVVAAPVNPTAHHTFLTTFTTFFTSLEGSKVVTKTSTSVKSNVITQATETEAVAATLNVANPDRLHPIMIYATKTFYTTTTFLTSIVGDGQTKIQSRTSIVSNVVTEAISTVINGQYLMALESSYLADLHPELIQPTMTQTYQPFTFTSHPEPGIRTIEGTYVPDTPPSQMYPHFPKDAAGGLMDRETKVRPSPTLKPPNFQQMRSEIYLLLQDLVGTSLDQGIEASTTVVPELVESFTHAPTPPLKTQLFTSTTPIKVKPVPTSTPDPPKVKPMSSTYSNIKPVSTTSLNVIKTVSSPPPPLPSPPPRTTSPPVEETTENPDENLEGIVILADDSTKVTPPALVFGPLKQPIGEDEKIFNLVSSELEEKDHGPDYYDESKEQNDDQEQEKGQTQNPVYKLGSSEQNIPVGEEETTTISLETLQQEILDEIPTETVSPSTTERIETKPLRVRFPDPIMANIGHPVKHTPRPPPVLDVDDDSDSLGNVYKLVLPKPPIVSSNSADDEGQDDSSRDEESEELDDEQLRKPILSGPSKSNIHHAVSPPLVSGPGHGHPQDVGSDIEVSPAGGFNWNSPLIKLGALGLGGLGASALTKSWPLLGSMLKTGLVPMLIARNDTHHEGLTNQKRPLRFHGGQGMQMQESAIIPRRPVISHANEPNFRYENAPHLYPHQFYPPNHPHMHVVLTPLGHPHQPNLMTNGNQFPNLMTSGNPFPNPMVNGNPFSNPTVNGNPFPHRLTNGRQPPRIESPEQPLWTNQIILPFPSESNEIEPMRDSNHHISASQEILHLRPPPTYPKPMNSILNQKNHEQSNNLKNNEKFPRPPTTLINVNDRRPILAQRPPISNEDIKGPSPTPFLRERRPLSPIPTAISQQSTRPNSKDSGNGPKIVQTIPKILERPSVLQPTAASDSQKQTTNNFKRQRPTSFFNLPDTENVQKNQGPRPIQPPILFKDPHGPISLEFIPTQQNHLNPALQHPNNPNRPHQNANHQNGIHQNNGNHQNGNHQNGNPQNGNPQNGNHQNGNHQNGNHQNGNHQNGGNHENLHTRPSILPEIRPFQPFPNLEPFDIESEETRNGMLPPSQVPLPQGSEERPQIVRRPQFPNPSPISRPFLQNGPPKQHEAHPSSIESSWEEPESILEFFKPGGFLNPFNSRPIQNHFQESSEEKWPGSNRPPNPRPPFPPRPPAMMIPLNPHSNYPTITLSSEETIPNPVISNPNRPNSAEFPPEPSSNLRPPPPPPNHSPPSQGPIPAPPPPQRFPYGGQGLYEINPNKPGVLLPGAQPNHPPIQAAPTLNSEILLPAWDSNPRDPEFEPPQIRPTQHFPPFQQRPSTVFIVEETYDPPPSSTAPPDRNHQLVIKEIQTPAPTSPPRTTTALPPLPTLKVVPSITTRKPIFIRRSSTTPKPSTPPTPTPFSFSLFPHGFTFSDSVQEAMDGVHQKPTTIYRNEDSNQVTEESEEGEQFGGSVQINFQDIPSNSSKGNSSSSTLLLDLSPSDESMFNSEEKAILNSFKPPSKENPLESEESSHWWATTFRPTTSPMLPTTFRNQLTPSMNNHVHGPTTFRPRKPLLSNAPNQVPSAPPNDDSLAKATEKSFENEGLDQVKLKNVEIHKTPGFVRTRGNTTHNTMNHPVLAFIPVESESDEEANQVLPSEESANSPNPESGNSVQNPLRNTDEENYDTYELPPPGYPAMRLTPPPAPPFIRPGMQQIQNQGKPPLFRRPMPPKPLPGNAGNAYRRPLQPHGQNPGVRNPNAPWMPAKNLNPQSVPQQNPNSPWNDPKNQQLGPQQNPNPNSPLGPKNQQLIPQQNQNPNGPWNGPKHQQFAPQQNPNAPWNGPKNQQLIPQQNQNQNAPWNGPKNQQLIPQQNQNPNAPWNGPKNQQLIPQQNQKLNPQWNGTKNLNQGSVPFKNSNAPWNLPINKNQPSTTLKNFNAPWNPQKTNPASTSLNSNPQSTPKTINPAPNGQLPRWPPLKPFPPNNRDKTYPHLQMKPIGRPMPPNNPNNLNPTSELIVANNFHKVKPIPLNPAVQHTHMPPRVLTRTTASTSTVPPKSSSEFPSYEEENEVEKDDEPKIQNAVADKRQPVEQRPPDLRPAADGDPFYESDEDEDFEESPEVQHGYGQRPIGGHLVNSLQPRPQPNEDPRPQTQHESQLPQNPGRLAQKPNESSLPQNPGRFPQKPNTTQLLQTPGRFPQKPNEGQLPTSGRFPQKPNQLPQKPNEDDLPKAEMEPPPINSKRLNAPALQLPSNGPIRIRPKPNLLRPQPNLLRPQLPVQKPSFHTIATLDHENKIIATNVIPAFPTSSNAAEIQPSPPQLESSTLKTTEVTPVIIGSVETVDLHGSEVPALTKPILKPTSDTSKTLTQQSTQLPKIPEIKPTRSFTRIPIRPTAFQNLSPRFPRPSTTTVDPMVDKLNVESESQNEEVQHSTKRTVVLSEAESGTDFDLPEPPKDSQLKTPEPYKPRKPFMPIRNPAESRLPPWKQRTTSTSTSTSTVSPQSSTRRFNFPTRIPSNSSFSQSVIKFQTSSTSTSTTAAPTKSTAATTTTTEEPKPLTTVKSIPAPVTPAPVGKVEDVELESSETSEDSEEILNGAESIEMTPTTFRPAVRPNFSTPLPPRENLTATTLITKEGPVVAMVKKVTVSTASSISTKLPQPKPTPTRYVTHSEIVTETVMETEINILPTSVEGFEPVTQTIILTKIYPPETVVSTILGSVTLVNTLQIHPTTVRTTILSQPTQIIPPIQPPTVLKKNMVLKPSSPGFTPTASNESTERKILKGGSGILIRKTTPPVQEIPKTTTTTLKPRIDASGSKLLETLNPICNITTCSAGNQMCRGSGSSAKCGCKAGYARLRPTFPCRPTFTYEMSVSVKGMEARDFNRSGSSSLSKEVSESNQDFMAETAEALEAAFMSTDLRRQFQGTEVLTMKPRLPSTIYVDFLVQLTVNMTQDRIRNHLIRSLRNSNFTVGQAGLLSPEASADFNGKEFNECLYLEFNDCSPDANCMNLPGSFTCECKEGFKERKRHRPGRECLSLAGCPDCNYKGNCLKDKAGRQSCDCFRWYGGTDCRWNLKVLLMGVVGVGSLLFCLVIVCTIITCRRKSNRPGIGIREQRPGSGRFMRYRSPTSQATLERTAIMHDTASSTGSEDTPLQRSHQPHTSYTPDSLGDHGGGLKNQRKRNDQNLINFSLRTHEMSPMSVVIPRAKIRQSPNGGHGRSSSGSGGASLGLLPPGNTDNSINGGAAKLLSYLEGRSNNKSIQPTTLQREKEAKAFRKLSLQERRISTGALVSSGTEVSARGGMRRRSTGLEPEFHARVYDKTLSDIRSSRASCYSCKAPSYSGYSESAGHTMAEKDGASTVYTVQGKLFRLTNDTDSNLSSD